MPNEHTQHTYWINGRIFSPAMSVNANDFRPEEAHTNVMSTTTATELYEFWLVYTFKVFIVSFCCVVEALDGSCFAIRNFDPSISIESLPFSTRLYTMSLCFFPFRLWIQFNCVMFQAHVHRSSSIHVPYFFEFLFRRRGYCCAASFSFALCTLFQNDQMVNSNGNGVRLK